MGSAVVTDTFSLLWVPETLWPALSKLPLPAVLRGVHLHVASRSRADMGRIAAPWPAIHNSGKLCRAGQLCRCRAVQLSWEAAQVHKTVADHIWPTFAPSGGYRRALSPQLPDLLIIVTQQRTTLRHKKENGHTIELDRPLPQSVRGWVWALIVAQCARCSLAALLFLTHWIILLL